MKVFLVQFFFYICCVNTMHQSVRTKKYVLFWIIDHAPYFRWPVLAFVCYNALLYME